MGKRSSQSALTRDEILAAGFRLLQDQGFEAVSMRNLAGVLDVQAASLYWHVAGKAELLGLMASAIYREARLTMNEETDWRSWLIEFGTALKRTFRHRRDSAKLCATAKPIGTAAESASAIAAPLVERGLQQNQAMTFQASVISLTMGWAIFEENGPMQDFLSELLSIDDSYRASLRAMVHGFSTL